MNQFQEFCTVRGLIVNSIEIGRWVRVPTIDHPRARNGSYKYLGSIGWAQNFESMPEPDTWKESGGYLGQAKLQADIQRKIQKNKEEEELKHRMAAEKAAGILKACEISTHPYMEKKGFHGNKMPVTEGCLVIPMYCDKKLVGLQFIKEVDGEFRKKMLTGMRASMAIHQLGSNKELVILCEGYATGLSIALAMDAVGVECSVCVTFSAGNLLKVASSNTYKGAKVVVVGDNDKSMAGFAAAVKTELPYWIPEESGWDANDYFLNKGKLSLANKVMALL